MSLSALDVAEYILQKHGRMSAMKLQKLVYYAQAWSLVWDDVPLFRDEIQAWKEGPVVRALWEKHRGQFTVSPGEIKRDPKALSKVQRETVDSIIKHYGKHDGLTLSNWTHREDPWNEARKGLSADASSDAEITHASMRDYYGSL
ncbi:MAG TPA: type II toxin-antitoxin system antitoxin SocA domain-containing protein [Fimbriimonas sp.]|nr:type II toxin-antitoxin system antitoxin SocA domain-containing protein [Fimbriimonas sp.]